MKPILFFALLSLALTEAMAEAPATTPSAMNPTVSLGYVILYVEDVGASLAFYEKAFGLPRRFFNADGDKVYGELDAGTVRLAFVSLALARGEFPEGVVLPSPSERPLGAEIAFVTADVPAVYARALESGAVAVHAPATKPWGQTVAYVRDNSGHLVSIGTPLP